MHLGIFPKCFWVEKGKRGKLSYAFLPISVLSLLKYFSELFDSFLRVEQALFS